MELEEGSHDEDGKGATPDMATPAMIARSHNSLSHFPFFVYFFV